jgi:hypothetical protein
LEPKGLSPLEDVEKVAIIFGEDLGKSGYKLDMKFCLKKSSFYIFGYTMKTDH